MEHASREKKNKLLELEVKVEETESKKQRIDSTQVSLPHTRLLSAR
jgi:hypothetical protein